MNSLTYLTRQFDVLASPRAPPSTPVSETSPSLGTEHQDVVHKRVRSWSTKSLRVSFPERSASGTWILKRSLSSADVNPAAAVDILHYPIQQQSSSSAASSQSKPSSRRPSLSSTEKAINPKRSSGAVLRSIFFVRIILQFWNAVCTAWRTLARRGVEVAVEEGTDEDEKDSEDESKDEKSVILDLPQTPYQPAIPPPFSAPLPSLPPPPLVDILPPDPSTPVVRPAPARDSPPGTDPDNPSLPPPSVASAAVSTLARETSVASRSSTPSTGTRKTGFHLPKTLVLDLDETLIHSTSRPMMHAQSSGPGLLGLGIFGRGNKGAGHVVEVVLGGRSTLYHVYKRPFVDYFLRKVSGWYTLVIFTASMQEYADPVIDWLDAGRGILQRRLFRESCTQLPNGSYTKDLSIVEDDLARVCLIDNSPVCYNINEANGIPIEGWTHDPHDEALLDLLPVLDSLRFTSDVRHVLGIRGFS